jgi:CheY-like chemotaxis protein
MDPKLILVVDDAEPTLILLHQVLLHLGHKVVLASNGQEAVAQAARHRPDLILLDVRIPGEDPRETMRSLAREGWAATTPVVALSPKGADDAALGDGYAGIVRKPVALPALVSTLRGCFDSGPAGETAVGKGKVMEAVQAEPPRP